MKEKVVLAYSGGLDTTAIIPWLKENYDYEVICVCIDCGQAEELDGLEERAKFCGAEKLYILDVIDEFCDDYVTPCVQAGAVYENKYLLGTSMARPLIAKKLVEIARKEGAVAICHGATGKGNDQIRFELGIKALAPDIKIIAAWRNDKWNMDSRESEIEYCKARELLPRRAKLRAMNLLQLRDYTEKQLRDKLLGGGYPESVADQAVEYVKSFRYIDDLRYAGDYLAAFAGRKSLRRMEQDLQQRGVSKDIIEQAAADWQQDGGQDELRMACALLEKKHYDKDSCDRKQQQRLYNFLAYRGFSGEIIRKALQTEWEYS